MLGEIGFVDAVEPLLQLARTNDDSDLRIRIVESLGRIGDERSVPLLREFARNLHAPLRLKAIDVLGRLHSVESIPLMVELFQEGDLEQKLTTARAILKCGAVGAEVLETFRLVGNQIVNQILDEVFEEAQWA
jgi:HEAT repeat protein